MPYKCPKGCGFTLYNSDDEGAECISCGWPYCQEEE